MPINDASLIDVSDEILMRQVHPSQVTEGRLASGQFTPTDSDNGHLSADRESLISPKEAYERYLKNKNLVAAGGAWGVSITEFSELGLQSYSDPLPENGAHALVDFNAAGDLRQQKLKGKLAYAKAKDRGRLYP
jgi:hypothetical protein